MSEWYRMKNGNSDNNSSELSVETSSDLTDSFNNLSPIPPAIMPRKLDFSSFDDEDGIKDVCKAPTSLSPPYKRVRALRLFDTPHTPKTLLEKCSTPTHPQNRMRLFPPKFNVPSGMPSGSSHHLHPPSDDDSALGSLQLDDDNASHVMVTTNSPSTRTHLMPPVITINPFTPDGQALNKKKRALSKTPTWDASPQQPAKRLRESNISRYNVEFVELGVVGCGEFGVVTKCLNKLDGCVYAIKRSLKPVAGSAQERAALTEVYAHAALGKHEHVVRYYSAWAEDDHMVIQNEYCDGGSLQEKIAEGPLPEPELLVLLAHVADGLAYFHSLQLVHMDLKPGNIFISRDDNIETNSEDSEDDDDEGKHKPRHKYKIGDLGHVTHSTSPTVEEGDCRYLPREVLQEDYTDLTKADIFAFGLTLYEAGGGGPMPQNGPQWQDIRDGNLPDLPKLSKEFNALLKKMTHPDPAVRPSAGRLRKHQLVCGRGDTSRAQLVRELAASNMRNELLTRKLQEAARCIKSLTPTFSDTKSRTRSAKRLQTIAYRSKGKPHVDLALQEVIQAVTSPRRSTRKNNNNNINNNNKKQQPNVNSDVPGNNENTTSTEFFDVIHRIDNAKL